MPAVAAAEELEPDVSDLLNDVLRMTAEVSIQQLENAARVDALPADEYPLWEIMEEIDDASCDLCIEMDGMIIDRDHPDFDDIQNPAHINCRRIMVGIGKDEVGPDDEPVEPTYERPSDELVQKHGHFMVDRERYVALRVPSQPEGRDFIAQPFVDPDGNRHVRLLWRVPEYFQL